MPRRSDVVGRRQQRRIYRGFSSRVGRRQIPAQLLGAEKRCGSTNLVALRPDAWPVFLRHESARNASADTAQRRNAVRRPMASIIELEVAAGPADGQFTVRVVRPACDGEPTATMQLDAGAYLSALNDLEMIVLASASAGRRILSPGEQRLRDVGRQLFDALFSGPVHEAYRASVSAADQRGER